MNTKITLIAFLLSISFWSHGQGCVAIRGFSSCNGNIGGGATLHKGEALVSGNFRYFKSFRHFRGSHEETERVEMGTEVINHSFFLDLSLNYGITDRLYANIVLPFVYHDRSSLYEHGGNPREDNPSTPEDEYWPGDRQHTKSSGLADMRLGVGYWLKDPAKNPKANYSLGLGIKLPTGKYDYKDTFYNQGENKDQEVEAVVDQSIQPGDGGLGIAIDGQGYHAVSESILINYFLYYLINPRETNGVLTRNSTTRYFASPDQFAVRLGANYLTKVPGLSVYLGGRTEGVPAKDLIGGSDGYRRPGYVISVEPGINYTVRSYSFTLNVPLAVARNRTQSYLDKVQTQETGVYRHGDAAFADYLINFNVAYRLGNKMKNHIDGIFE